MDFPTLNVAHWDDEAPRLRDLIRSEEYGSLPELDAPRIDVWRFAPPGRPRATFVGVRFSGPFDPALWGVETLLNAGFGLATFDHGDVVPDDAALASPVLARLGAEGAIAAWAAGLLAAARTVEGPVLFVGHSRIGKAALLAGAFGGDGVACIQSGCGGAAPCRTTVGETVGQITERFPHWFTPKFASYAGREATLPFDQHALLALCAPKPLLLLNADDDLWANPDGQEAMAELARPVYAAQGAPDALGTFRRPGGHAVTTEDWKAIAEFFGPRFL